MKKLLLILFTCMLIVGCGTTNAPDSPSANDENNHTFMQTVDLGSFMNPLVDAELLAYQGGSADNPDFDWGGIEFKQYDYSTGENWHASFTQQKNEGVDYSILEVYDSPKNVLSSVSLSITTGPKVNEAYLYIQDASGDPINVTMDRKDGKTVGCIAYEVNGENYIEKECSEEQETIALRAQEKMSTILKNLFIELKVDLSVSKMNFYKDVDISENTAEILPVWSGENPIPAMEEKASTKQGFTKNESSENMAINYMEGNNNISIMFNKQSLMPTLYIQVTPQDNENGIIIFSANYENPDDSNSRSVVTFSSENGKYSCSQNLGNNKTSLMCHFAEGDQLGIATEEQVEVAKAGLNEIKNIFIDLGVDFSTYFNLTNLK